MQPEVPSQREPNRTERLAALDAYRGFVMLLMASAGFGLPQAAMHFRDSRAWQFLGSQFAHSQWVGATLWDLIQPSFMFIVGVSLAYSWGRRRAEGQAYSAMLAHAIYRSCALVLLGVMIQSQSTTPNNYVLTNVLSQIGLGYVFLFLLCNRRPAWQAAAAVLILIGDWALFYGYPTPPPGFDYSTVGVPADWPHLQGIEAHWDKNTNVAAAIDRVILNGFRHDTKFLYHGGGYTTLNFVPSLGTMIFGLMAGGWLCGNRSPRQKLLGLCGAGLLCLGIGAAISALGVCPLVKRVWTPSWAVFSAGGSLLLLAAFYAVMDFGGYRRAAWPLTIFGMNSFAAYYLALTVCAADGHLARGLQTCLGPDVFSVFGLIDEVFAPIVRMTTLLAALWLVCAWLYQQKIFIKL